MLSAELALLDITAPQFESKVKVLIKGQLALDEDVEGSAGLLRGIVVFHELPILLVEGSRKVAVFLVGLV